MSIPIRDISVSQLRDQQASILEEVMLGTTMRVHRHGRAPRIVVISMTLFEQMLERMGETAAPATTDKVVG